MSKRQGKQRSLVVFRPTKLKIKTGHSARIGILTSAILNCFLSLACFQEAEADQEACINGMACSGRDKIVATIATSPELTVNIPPSRAPELRQLNGFERCSDLPVEVGGATPDEFRLACAAARQVFGYLSVCGIYPLQTVRIRIDPDRQHPQKGRVFAMYDTDFQTVVITALAQVRSLVRGTPYDVIPEREFFRSVVVHEVTHAVLHRHYKSELQSQSAQEYPAYALQYKSLSDDTRTRLLSEIGIDEAGNSVFNDILLALNPFRFGAQVYKHYVRAVDSCANFHQLLRNEAKFVWSMPRL